MACVLLRPGPRGSASRLLLAPQGAEREAPLLHRAEEVAVPGWHAARSSRGTEPSAWLELQALAALRKTVVRQM